ncbi:hypothetical protein Taro_004521 [Colocasia esculenta]|uniref:Transcription initiation factor TFIID subunit 1 n=1 Tax=Colocasia esculenta TaxID=4460 RepID=A0A843TQD7_COLES|nr:hypothetical protein [Colocasia esculenta]
MDSNDDADDEHVSRSLLGFMFGNVDISGDVDASYLDEDAREHLAALADQLGPSLADLDLVESTSAPAEEDHAGTGEPLADGGDADDLNGESDAGAAMAEEARPFPDEEFLLSDPSMNRSYVPEEEDYDADDGTAMETQAKGEDAPPPGSHDRWEFSDGGYLPSVGTPGDDVHLRFDAEGLEEEAAVAEEPVEPRKKTNLPVLCVENGMEILRFSEIFGVYEPLKKAGRRRTCLNMNSKPSIEIAGVVDTIEDDEESFLKSACQAPAIDATRLSSVQGDCVKVGGGVVGSLHDEHGRDSCLPGQPMKERMARDTPPRWWEPDCSGFDPLDQQDWEDQIVWGGSSPAASHETLRSCVMSEHGSDISILDAEAGEVVSSEYSWQLSQIEPNADHSSASLRVSGEPSISSRIPGSATSQSSLGLRGRQPLALRLDSCLKGSKLEGTNVKSMAGKEKAVRDAAARCIKNLSLQNQDLLDGCWLDQIIWDPRDPIPKPKLVLDLQDEQMPLETLGQNNIGQVSSHAASIIPSYPLQTPSEDYFGYHCQHGLPSDGFDISNDEFYSDWVTGQQFKSYSKRRANHLAKVIHSAPALKLQTMKPKLSNKELANFHRPRALWYPCENEFASRLEGTRCTQGSIKIILKSLGGKKIKLLLDVKDSLSSIKIRLSKKLDFKLPEKVKIFYTGRELQDDMSLADQDVKPNSLLYIVWSKIHLWSDPQLLPNANESLCLPRAFRRMSDLSVRDGHVFLMEYCEERPLLLGNVGMAARLCTYYRKSELDDVTALPPQKQHDILGNVLTLDPADESPFLGDLTPGCSQPSLETNLLRAPLFPHKLLTTNYLLVRSANGMLSLRRINRVCVVGQQEPHIEVISPGVRGVRNYNSRRLLVHVYREFYAKQKSGLPPYIRADDLSLQFPSLTEAFLRKRLKHCAKLQKRLNGRSFWVKKPNFQIPCEEEIRRILAPEDVCCYESMQAGLYRLKHLGISRLRRPVCLSSRLSEALTRVVASHIEGELLITPWNLSRSFVSYVNQSMENIHRLEISGSGDPSGCGLGFSYIRATWPTPRLHLLSTTKQKKAPAVQVGSASDRTDTEFCVPSIGTDFYYLSKSSVHDHQIMKMTRYDQNATIHQPLSEQYAPRSKTDTATLSKRSSYLLLLQEAKRKCQEIWELQVQSLSGAYVNEYESSPKAGGDLDPLAVDLENFLDVEEFAEGKDSLEHRNEITGVNVEQLMGRHPYQVLREEENEDEKAEAALISKWLDDDDVTIMGGKLKQVKKHSRTLTSKGITMQNNELQRIPVEMKLSLHLKAAYESDIHAGLVKVQDKAIEDGQNFVDRKELTGKPTRQFFACGACGQMGHMRTNKDCPKYREDLGASETDGIFAKSKIVEDGMQLSLQTTNSKFLRVEHSERSDKSELDVPRRLQLKFKYVPPDKHHEIKISGPHCSNRGMTLKEETDSKSMEQTTATPYNTKAEDKQENVQKSPLVLRLSAHQKIRFKPLKGVNNLEQGTQAAGMEQDDESTDLRKISKLGSSVERKQLSQWSRKKTIGSKTVELRNYEKMAEESLWRTRGQTSLQIDGHGEADREHAQKRKKNKRKPVSLSSYSKEYKTSRETRRMHERDQAANEQPRGDLGCHVAEYTLPTKRHRGGEVLLSNILENIVNSLRENNDISYLFMKPVSKREAPDYLDIIKDPMDLSIIKEKVRKMEYKSREDFRHDVWQINFNAHSYNDVRSPSIGHLADQLLDLCDRLLSQNSAILTEAEGGIEL